MSEKIQIIKELFALAKELIYPPTQEETTPEEKKVNTAIGAVKELAHTAVEIQRHEYLESIASFTKTINKEINKLKIITTAALLLSLISVILTVFLNLP